MCQRAAPAQLRAEGKPAREFLRGFRTQGGRMELCHRDGTCQGGERKDEMVSGLPWQ